MVCVLVLAEDAFEGSDVEETEVSEEGIATELETTVVAAEIDAIEILLEALTTLDASVLVLPLVLVGCWMLDAEVPTELWVVLWVVL